MFVPVNNNQLQFRINLAPQQAMPQETVAAAQGSAAFLGSVPGEAQAFVLAAQLDKLAAVPLPQDPRWQLALVCFKQVKNLCFSGQVQNLHLLIHGDIVCKDAASAGGIAQILLNCRDKFANKIKSNIKIMFVPS